MSSIEQCRYDIRRYNRIKTSVNSIISRLASATRDMNDFSNEIKNKYLINDDCAPIILKSNKLETNLKDVQHTLKNKVIPAIDNSIYKLKKTISQLEAEEQAAEENEQGE